MNDSIKNYYLEETEDIFEKLGEARYRARQLFSWLYAKNITSFDQMSNYSKELRSKLSEMFTVSPLVLEERLLSKIDGTEKFLFKTEDGHYIESVLLRNEKSGGIAPAALLRSGASSAQKVRRLAWITPSRAPTLPIR